ncbi:hypothetical protein L6164_035244 [Bauhinia variegata]|uniref:Uncharacterized protein n=1 Tax=Bauhinia variegata TaxID=167791 RepID=A0ACB9KX92_BAUVA|nr:hypothetical protein L6164_035244 [Bauhinia variegata]
MRYHQQRLGVVLGIWQNQRNLHLLDNSPHDWLFTRCSAVATAYYNRERACCGHEIRRWGCWSVVKEVKPERRYT